MIVVNSPAVGHNAGVIYASCLRFQPRCEFRPLAIFALMVHGPLDDLVACSRGRIYAHSDLRKAQTSAEGMEGARSTCWWLESGCASAN